jgi:hypothetical protein
MINFLQGYREKTDFCKLLIRAAMDFRIPEEELMEMDLLHVLWMYDHWYDETLRTQANFANLMALIANCHRKKDSPLIKPEDFMPQKPKTEEDLEREILTKFKMMSGGNPQG